MKELEPDIKAHPNNRPAYRIMIFLVVLSILGIVSRHILLGPQALAGGDKIWRLGIDISIPATSTATALKIYPPISTSNIRTIERSIFHPNIRIKNSYDDDKVQRTIYAVTSGKGPHKLSINFFLHQSQTPFTSLSKDKVPLGTQQREMFLSDTENLQLNSYMVQKIAKELLSRELTQTLRIYEAYLRIKSLSLSDSDKQDVLSVPLILAKRNVTILDQSLAMVAICRAMGMPARIVTGIILKDDIESYLHHWVEVFDVDKWLSYDLKFGYVKTVPINYLPISRNNADIVQVLKGGLDKVEYELEQEFDHPYLKTTEHTNIFSIFDLSRLPLNVRDQLAVLLLLPLGALITALCRHIIGVHSYGVFTPTLLALAIVYNDLISTAITFFIVCTLAILGRSLFPASLMRTPRLSIIFTLVAIIIALSVSVMDHFELTQVGRVILLPVIILTTLVDNFYRTIDEKGITIAMRRIVWTIIITLLCLPVMQFETLGHLILKYPEIHFTTLALFLMVSTYKGKQLITLPILSLLAEPSKPTKKK